MSDSSIIVEVSKLRSVIQDIRRSGSDFVELTISPAFEEDGETYPKSLEFTAYKQSELDLLVEFEPLEVIENEKELKKETMFSARMSSNLL